MLSALLLIAKEAFLCGEPFFFAKCLSWYPRSPGGREGETLLRRAVLRARGGTEQKTHARASLRGLVWLVFWAMKPPALIHCQSSEAERQNKEKKRHNKKRGDGGGQDRPSRRRGAGAPKNAPSRVEASAGVLLQTNFSLKKMH